MAASRGGRLYVMGGFTEGPGGWEATDRAWVLFDRRWHPLPDLPEPRAAGGAAIVRNRIYIVGGARGTAAAALARTSLYLDLRTLRWTTFAGVTPAAEHLGVSALGGRVYAVGGRTRGPSRQPGAAEVYDTVARTWTRLPDVPTRRAGGGLATADRLVVSAGGDGPRGPSRRSTASTRPPASGGRCPAARGRAPDAALVGLGRIVYQASAARSRGSRSARRSSRCASRGD